MATVKLYPDSTVSNTNWTVTGDTIHERLTSTTEGSPHGSGIATDDDGAVCVVTLEDFDLMVWVLKVLLQFKYYLSFIWKTKVKQILLLLY